MIEIKCDVRGCGKRVPLAEDKGSAFGLGFPLPPGWRLIQQIEELPRAPSPMEAFKALMPPETRDAMESAEDLFPIPKKTVTTHICSDHELPNTTSLDS